MLASDWLLTTQSVSGPGKMDVVFMAGLVTKIPLLLPLINYSPHVRQTESQHTLYIKHQEKDIVVKDNLSTNVILCSFTGAEIAV